MSKPQFGDDYLNYEKVLDLAHKDGLKRISTTLVQAPTAENGKVAIVTAEVETSKGVFSGIGDADPTNVNRMILPHLLRMAETRAKARALKDAVNKGAPVVEEFETYGDTTVNTKTGEIQAEPAPAPTPTPTHATADNTPFDAPSAQGDIDRLRRSISTLKKELHEASGIPFPEINEMLVRGETLPEDALSWNVGQLSAAAIWLQKQVKAAKLVGERR